MGTRWSWTVGRVLLGLSCALGLLAGSVIAQTSVTIVGTPLPTITIQEVDGTPSGPISVLKVSNTALTVHGDGSATLLAGGGAGVTDGDKSDISVTGTGTVWTIDPGVVTYPKLQAVSAPLRLLGRGDSGAGVVQELSLGTNLSISGTTLNATVTAATAWSAITGGTNTGQAFLVGTGSSLGVTGAGTITATSVAGIADLSALLTTTSVHAVTNKQLVPRVVAQTVTANTITPNCDTTDLGTLDTIAADLTIAAPVCTGLNPRDGQELTLRLRSSSMRTLTWNAAYSADNGIPLPLVTTGDGVTYDYMKFVRNSTSATWGLVATTRGLSRGVTSLASQTTYTCPADLSALCEMQMTGVSGTLTMAAPTGTVPNGTLLRLGLMCTNQQTFAWNAIFLASPNIALPTTCPAIGGTPRWTLAGFQFSSVLGKWQLIALN